MTAATGTLRLITSGAPVVVTQVSDLAGTACTVWTTPDRTATRTVPVTTSSDLDVVVDPGTVRVVVTAIDGTTLLDVASPVLSGQLHQLTVPAYRPGIGFDVVAALTGAAAASVPSPATSTVTRLLLTAATCTVTLPTPATGASCTVVLVQDATGGRAVTWTGATVRWVNTAGTAPTLATTAGARTVVTFLAVDSSEWLGMAAGGV